MGRRMKAKAPVNWFEFTSVPPIGLRIRYRKTFLTLIDVTPCVRKDGQPSNILTWKNDDGRLGTSGLRGSGVTWSNGVEK